MSQSAFDRVRDDFTNSLHSDLQIAFQACRSSEQIYQHLEGERRIRSPKRTDDQMFERFTAILPLAVTGINHLTKAFNIFCNLDSAIVDALWGGLQVVVQKLLFASHSTVVKVNLFTGLSQSIGAIKSYDDQHSAQQPIQDCLRDLYQCIFVMYLDLIQISRQAQYPRFSILCCCLVGQSTGTKRSLAEHERRAQDCGRKISQLLEYLDVELSEHNTSQVQNTVIEPRDSQLLGEETLITDQSMSLQGIYAEEAVLAFLKWLSPFSVNEVYQYLLDERYPGTCSWIFNDLAFEQWMQQESPYLWVSGIPGIGKSVLCAAIIQYLSVNISKHSGLTYYFFDHHSPKMNSVDACFRSILSILARQNRACLWTLRTYLGPIRASDRPIQLHHLLQCFQQLKAQLEMIYIVIDGLDECDQHVKLLECLQRLQFFFGKKIKVLLFGRSLPDIRHSLQQDIPDLLNIKVDEVNTCQDIQIFAEGRLATLCETKQLKFRDSRLKQDIVTALVKHAEGMFLWAKCQLDQIQRLPTDKSIRESLDTLPRGLYETYSRAFKRIRNNYSGGEIQYLQRFLLWYIHGRQPLNLIEMAEFISITPTQTNFDIYAVANDPVKLINCSEGLITIHGDKDSKLRLSHSSIKEFLMSDRCLEELPEFYMGTAMSNAKLAELCLTVLNFEDFVRMDQSDTRPQPAQLYEYAVSYWHVHYQLAKLSDSCPRQLAQSMLNNIEISDPFKGIRHFAGLSMHYLPIHYCAQYGLDDILVVLLKVEQNIDIPSEPFGSPLNFAARYDQAIISEILLDHGADVNSTIQHKHLLGQNNCLHWALDEDRAYFASLRLVQYIAETPGLAIDAMGGCQIRQAAIHYAAAANRCDILDVLVKCAASIDAKTAEGKTALQIAIAEKSMQAIAFLLDHGASINRNDGCNSMKESGFGLSETLSESLLESQWETAFVLSTGETGADTLRTWKFSLGAAVQEGNIEQTSKLLAEVDSLYLVSGSEVQRLEELESYLGTMFGALSLALNTSHAKITISLLKSMISLLSKQQGTPASHSSLDLHNIIICDRADSPFSSCKWTESFLYITILLGYLKISLEKLCHAIHSHDDIDSPKLSELSSSTNENVDVLLPRPILLPIIAGLPRLASEKINHPLRLATNIAGASSRINMQNHHDEDISRACEDARSLWKAKGNIKTALHTFFNVSNSKCVAWTEEHKIHIISFLVGRGLDINCLDGLGRTILYWSRVHLWHDLSNTIQALGGILFVDPKISFLPLQNTVQNYLARLVSASEGLEDHAIYLARKWDWDNLARALLFAGDVVNACKAFEAGTVFDEDNGAEVPAFHYFICDSCHTDYMEDHLLRGRRYIPTGLINIDLCMSCSLVFGPALVSVPREEWIRERIRRSEETREAFASYESVIGDVTKRDNAKIEWKRQEALTLKKEIDGWVANLQDTWESPSTSSYIQDQYINNEKTLALWMSEATEGMTFVSDLSVW